MSPVTEESGRDLKITYQMAIENNYAIWRAFNDEYWRPHYFIDWESNVRHHHFGEGSDDESERVIQKLLEEGGHTNVDTGLGLHIRIEGLTRAAPMQGSNGCRT